MVSNSVSRRGSFFVLTAGRFSKAVGEGQIKQLLAACTAYVSMDNTNEATGNQMDTHLKNTVHSFNRTEGIEDVFDEKARNDPEVDERCATIREEYARGDAPIHSLNHSWRCHTQRRK